MADYLISQYDIPSSALLLEESSTTTEENFNLSRQLYPDFFEDTINGERKLGLVSHQEHLKRATILGSVALACAERQIVGLPVYEIDWSNIKLPNLTRPAKVASPERR